MVMGEGLHFDRVFHGFWDVYPSLYENVSSSMVSSTAVSWRVKTMVIFVRHIRIN